MVFEESFGPVDKLRSIKSKITEFAKLVEQKISVNLIEEYNAIGDGNADEIDGEYIVYSFGNVIESDLDPDHIALSNLGLADPHLPDISRLEDSPTISIFENGNFQFYHDTEPYPSLSNTKEEADEMGKYLGGVSTPISKLTIADVVSFFTKVLANHN